MKNMLIHAIDPTAWLGTIEVRPIQEVQCGRPEEAG